MSSSSEWTPAAADTYLSIPQRSFDHSKPHFVASVGPPLPSGDSGNGHQRDSDSASSSPDLSAHESEVRQPGEGTDEGTSLLQAPLSQQETNSDSSLPSQDQKPQRCYKRLIIRVLLISTFIVVSIVGFSVLGKECWSSHPPIVSNKTRVISENSTVSLGDLPYDRVNITAQDPNEYHHTTEIYQLSYGAISNQTSYLRTCIDKSFPDAEAFPLDFQAFIYSVRDSKWECVVSVSSALSGSRIVIALFDNQRDSLAFRSNETVSGALFSQSLTVLENETTFPPLSFTVPVDSYIFPAASITAPMNISICQNIALISYSRPQTSAVCTIRTSTDYCDINIAKDTCLFAYTYVEEFAQTSDLSLNLQGTRRATTPHYCVSLTVLVAAVLVLLIFILIIAHLCWCKCHHNSEHSGNARSRYVFN